MPDGVFRAEDDKKFFLSFYIPEGRDCVQDLSGRFFHVLGVIQDARMCFEGWSVCDTPRRLRRERGAGCGANECDEENGEFLDVRERKFHNSRDFGCP